MAKMTREEAEEGARRGDLDAERSLAAYRAWDTMHRADEDEELAEGVLNDAADDEVDATGTYQIYAWTYSGIPNSVNRAVVKIGFAGTGGTSNAWVRMEASRRRTGSPGAPTMYRVWQGSGGRDAARQSEKDLQSNAGRQIIGGGSEWYTADLQALDLHAESLGLERVFALNPA